MQDASIYIKRRNELINQLNSGIIIVPTTDEIIRNQDSTFQYRFDSYFYYLTGFNEPEAVLVIDIDKKKSVLFCREKNPQREIWDGFRYGVQASRTTFGFTESYNIESFAEKIGEYLINAKNLYYTLGHFSKYDQIIIHQLNQVRGMFRRGVEAPQSIIDINHIIGEMRVIKDEEEIKLLTKSCEISGLAHIAAMQEVKQAKFEYQIEAKILQVFYAHGSRYPAYSSIVGSGKNACILHYRENNQPLNDGDMLLVDAGAEYKGYAGDITRSYPVNGKFTKAQQALYEIVLEANKQAINKVMPGNLWNEPGDIATQILTQGLIDLGLLKGSLTENLAKGNYRQFYMHGIGHWLGLDVHDVGKYKLNGQWRSFMPGMCTTIEPGLYIAPANNIPQEYWNIGIRIEDNILLTKTGNVNLTFNTPKEIRDLKAVING